MNTGDFSLGFLIGLCVGAGLTLAFVFLINMLIDQRMKLALLEEMRRYTE